MTDPSGNIDFFISYRGPQAAWASWINWVVRTAGAGEGDEVAAIGRFVGDAEHAVRE